MVYLIALTRPFVSTPPEDKLESIIAVQQVQKNSILGGYCSAALWLYTVSISQTLLR